MSNPNPAAARKGARPLMTPRMLRDLHLYLAVFFAPSILFFALTGALQLFGLHEARGAGYAPPAVIEKLAQVHIHQRYVAKPSRPRPATAVQPAEGAASAPAANSAPPKAQEKEPSTLAIQIFFLGTALGLTLASLLGLWIGLTQGRLRKVSAVLAALGTVLPILLVAFQ
uniref:Uncharacterized protein n=1 Tax=Caulobacter sp. (strain K31) TaxID=366602 RepID=B0SZF6_CAUSK